MRTLAVLFILFASPCFAGEVISGYNNDTLSVLNNELRGLSIENQVKRYNRLNVYGKQIENVATPETNDAGTNKYYVDLNDVVEQIVYTEKITVGTGTTVIPYDDTIPQITEGDEYMTCSITPKSTTNKLKIDVVVFLSHNAGSDRPLIAALFQGSTANALAAGVKYQPSAGAEEEINFSHFMTASTTSTITFKVRAGCGLAGTTTVNGSAGARKLGGVMPSSITITEYK